MSLRIHNLASLSFVLVACQSTYTPPVEEAPPEPAAPEVPLAIGPERALAIVGEAKLAFQPQGDAHIGRHRVHEARVERGVIAVTPFTMVGGNRTAHPPMSFETSTVTMDLGVIATRATRTRLEGGTVVIDRDQVTEKVRNLDDGVQQEWHFATAPEIAGDLVVDVTPSNRYDYITSTAGGLHFASPGRDIGFRYSHAVWIGADGKEWEIPAVFDGSHIRMTVPGDIVERTQFPAVLDPTITPEVTLDAPVPGFTGANAQNASVAFDGTNFLVVWDDNRNSQDSDIWATRVSQAGSVIDALGIQIAAGVGRQQKPTVAFNGTQYVVAWEDFKVAGGTEADIAVAAVSTAGAVTQLGSLPVAVGLNETQPRVAAGGGSELVVWNGNGDIFGAVRSSGAFGAPFAIAATANAEIEPTVARDPAGNYLVAWSEGVAATADLRGQFVTTAGALSGASFTISAGGGRQSSPAAAFDGTNFQVVWMNSNAGVNLFGTRVTTAGAILDNHTEGAAMVGGATVSGAADNQEAPAIACQATGCLVAWQDRRNLATTGFDIFAQRINPDFTLNGGEFIVATDGLGQFLPAVAATGTAFYAAWHDNRDGNANQTFGSTISTAGAVGANVPLATGNNRESAPRIGRAGTNFGVFFSDSRAFGNDIRYIRFTTAGTKLDANSLVASSATDAQTDPAASTDLGANTFVVWADTRNNTSRDIFGARVSLTGGVVDANGIAITTATADQVAPDVASNGSVALVVWQDRRNGAATNFDIFGALVDANGAILVADIPICTAVLDQTRPAVAFDTLSGQFIVVWSDGRTGSPDIFGARVTTAGAVLDANGVVLSNAASSQFQPGIASGPSGSFVVWEDRRAGQDIFGTRVTGGAALTALDGVGTGVAVSQAAGSQTQPRVAFVAGFWTVVWTDARNTQTDIFGQQINTNGTLFGSEFVVSNTADSESHPAITNNGTTQGRVAYQTAKPALATTRVFTRVIGSSSANGQVCSGPSQCASGFCVDGRCCESACGGNHVVAGPKGSAIAGDCHACANKYTGQADGICTGVAVGTICRDYVSSCDVQERCDGTTAPCAADSGQNQGLVCQKSSNFPPGSGTGICPANAPPGPHFCQ